VANSILPGTASPGDWRATKTASAGTNFDVAGTLAEVAGGNTITPGTTAQTAIAANTIANAAIGVAGEPNLTPDNVAYGSSIFGVAGTAARGASGSLVASGPPFTSFTVSCGFQPSHVSFVSSNGSNTQMFDSDFNASETNLVGGGSPYACTLTTSSSGFTWSSTGNDSLFGTIHWHATQ